MKSTYVFPSLELLDYHNAETNYTNREYVKAMAEELGDTLEAFKIKGRITDIHMSPYAVRFDFLPDPGVTVKSIQNLHVDLEVHMASPVEIVSVGDGKYSIGLAIKKWERPLIGLRDIMETEEFKNNDYVLPIAAGMDVIGKPFVFDLADTPHLLVAGTTGSGKSTFINDIIMSILYTRTPEEVRFLMIDAKGVELIAYNKIPHLQVPVAKSASQAFGILHYAEQEMNRRYKEFSNYRVKNIDDYNAIAPEDKALPRIVIIVDEYMEMMFEAPRDLEDVIARLARLSRAAGIHLVLATQRPSSDVITSDIKANIQCRASFTVVDWRESKTIIDRTGAERLLGNGDMLYSAADAAVPVHAQASFVSYDEVDRVIEAVHRKR